MIEGFRSTQPKAAYIELKKDEKINLPTVGPGPMTASAIITNCGIYEKQMTFLSAPLDQLKDT